MAAPLAATDVDCRTGMPLRWSIVSGRPSLLNNLVRRLTTPTGSLPDDPTYGIDIRRFLSAGLTPGGVNRLRGLIVDQVGADPLVQSVDDVAFLFSQGFFQITIAVTDAQGPFDLVLLVDELTVSLLNEGSTAAAPVAGAVTAVVTVGTGGAGPAGPPGASTAGPPGPTGPAGAGGVSLPFGEFMGSSLGTEEFLDQVVVDFSLFVASTLAFELLARGASVSGTATLRMYVGGNYGVADGTLVGSTPITSASLASISISNSITNPTGVKPVKLTLQSSAGGVTAQVQGAVVSVH